MPRAAGEMSTTPIDRKYGALMKTVLNARRRLGILFAGALLAACGGGGSSSAPPAVPLQITSAACLAKHGEPGYDVVLLVGQSNMSGYGGYIVPGFDTTDPRIQQWGHANAIELAIDPLQHPDAPFNTGRIGPGMSFARAYLKDIPAVRKILLVPAAYKGSGFADARWNPGDDLFEGAVVKANAAMASNASGNCIAAVLWSQGESDVGRLAPPAYQTALDHMIKTLRSRVSGAQAAPFILGQFSPDWTGPTPSAEQQGILDAINDTTKRLPLTAIASTKGLTSNVTQGLNGAVHLDAASQRIYGLRFRDAIAVSMGNSAPP